MYNVGAILDEFAEFLSDENDESDGHRLADFLQKKSGARAGPRHVFAHINPGRFSFKRRTSKRFAATELSENAQSEQNLPKDAEVGNATENGANRKEVEGVLQPMGIVRSNPTSPIQNFLSPMTHLSVSKSGGGVSGARCRSQSLRRLATIGRRRTLLEEFDQVSSVFAPHVFSTPSSFVAALPATPIESVALNNIPPQEKTQILKNKSVASLQRKQQEVQNDKSRSSTKNNQTSKTIPLSDTAPVPIDNFAPSPTIANAIQNKSSAIAAEVDSVNEPMVSVPIIYLNEEGTNAPISGNRQTMKHRKKSENDIKLEDIFTDEEGGCTAQHKASNPIATGTQPLRKRARKKASKGDKSTHSPSYNLALPEHNEHSLQYPTALNEEINTATNEEINAATSEEIHKAINEVDLQKSVALRRENTIYQSELDVPIEKNIMATEELDAAPERAVELPEMADELLPILQEFDNAGGADVLCEEAMPMMQQMEDQTSESALVDDRSCDQVSIIPLSRRNSEKSTTSRKSKRGSKEKIPISDELQKYLDVSKKINKKKTSNKVSNKSKRLLYTKGQSDAEDTIINPVPRKSAEKSVTSPPLDNRSKFTEHIVPSTSNITMSPRPHTRSSRSTVMSDLPLPPPEQFANVADSAKDATEKTAGPSTGVAGSGKNVTDDTIFKKPKLPVRKSLRSSKKQNKKISMHSPVSQDLEPPAESTTGLRRSSRTHRLCPPANIVLFTLMYQDLMDRRQNVGQKRRRIDSYAELSISNEELVSYKKNSLLVKQKNPQKVTNSASKEQRKPRKTSKNVRMPPIYEDQPETHANQPSDLSHPSDPMNEFQNAQCQEVTSASNSTEEADPPQPSGSSNISQAASSCSYALATGSQLCAEEALSDSKASSSKTTSSRQSSKKVRVRLERTKMPYTTSTTAPVRSKSPATVPPSTMNEAPFGYDTSTTTNITATSASIAENREFLSWLINAPNEETSNAHRLKISHCSAADDIIFRDIEGVEYGFYETEQQNSIGYLRFKPQKYRPVTIARARNLHFLVITGKFKITIFDEAGFFGIGDMIIIPKGSRYSIKNTTDAAAVLMIVNR